MSKNCKVFVFLFLAMIANSLNGQTTYDIYNVSSVMKSTNELLPKHRSAARVDIQSIEECSQCSGLVVIQYLDGKTSIIKR